MTPAQRQQAERLLERGTSLPAGRDLARNLLRIDDERRERIKNAAAGTAGGVFLLLAIYVWSIQP